MILSEHLTLRCPVWRRQQIGYLVLCLALLSTPFVVGCSKEQPAPDAFMERWNTLADTSEGYSPSTADLKPEPRELLRYTPPIPALPAENTSRTGGKSLPVLPVSLKLNNVELSVALRSLATAGNVNLLLSSGISGTVTLNVQKAPWRSVFLGLLASNGLEYRQRDNVVQVFTIAEKQHEVELQILENRLEEQRTLARQNRPLSVSVVNVRYADAAALGKRLEKIVTMSAPEGQRASIEVDEHSRALIILASDEELQRLIKVVEALDRPRPQVRLRAYIVEATRETSRELGLEWGGIGRTGTVGRGKNRAWFGSGASGSTGRDPVSTPLKPNNNASSGLGGIPLGMSYAPVDTSGMGTLGFMYGRIGGNLLELQLHLLEREGQLQILCSPSVTTLDNHTAYTENGQSVPYVATSALGDREVRFENAVLRLELTPNVIDAENLKLHIMVRKDEVDTSRNVGGNPFIIKKQTETTLVMGNGETVVISGLTKEKNTTTDAGAPGLRNLPGGKTLFGHESRANTLEEVLIFITPDILPPRPEQRAEHAGSPEIPRSPEVNRQPSTSPASRAIPRNPAPEERPEPPLSRSGSQTEPLVDPLPLE